MEILNGRELKKKQLEQLKEKLLKEFDKNNNLTIR